MWGALELGLANARIKRDTIMGFGVDKLLIVKEGEHAKTKGERLWTIFFGQWVIDHSIVP